MTPSVAEGILTTFRTIKNKNSGAVTKTDIAKNSKATTFLKGYCLYASCPSTIILMNSSASTMYNPTWTPLGNWENHWRLERQPVINACLSWIHVIWATAYQPRAFFYGRFYECRTEESIIWRNLKKDFFQKIETDVLNSMGIIFGVGLGVTIVVGFLFFYFLRIPCVDDNYLYNP